MNYKQVFHFEFSGNKFGLIGYLSLVAINSSNQLNQTKMKKVSEYLRDVIDNSPVVISLIIVVVVCSIIHYTCTSTSFGPIYHDCVVHVFDK